jgi:hypothetical protein
MPEDFLNRIVQVKTAPGVQSDPTTPWKLYFHAQIESRFIFYSAITKSILPFYLYNPAMVTLPITIEIDKEDKKQIVMRTAGELMEAGELDASKWFANAERAWEVINAEEGRHPNSPDSLNWLNKLTDQNMNARYLVLYNAAAKDASALVVDRKDMALEFIAENTTHAYYTTDGQEAYYLSSILNSTLPHVSAKDPQARKLWDAKYARNRMLDSYFPQYDKTEALHARLAALGAECHCLAKEFVSTRNFSPRLLGRELGCMRADIKKHLSANLEEIDRLVGLLL